MGSAIISCQVVNCTPLPVLLSIHKFVLSSSYKQINCESYEQIEDV